MALFRLGVLELLLEDDAGREDQAVTPPEELVRHARVHGLAHWEAAGSLLRCAEAVARRGDAEALDQLRGLVSARQAAGVGLGATLDLLLLARAHGQLGRYEEGLQVLEQARALIESQGERLWEPEVHRLEGEWRSLRPELGGTSAAQHWLRRALETASRQSTRFWELRAATSIARLLHDHGPGEDARQALATAYAGFSEGHDTLDLRRAAALLESGSNG